ncbi:hypothetical protein DM02DRAFT_26656 [Periconia macrospinosa]|uniref:Rhodopsin domain-containing protein n=1 Tax=Periconia macrospinosa TaxID=97972 RepID=A0A2V1DL87_9PLEO|nr:hypothetical protein DM02DRAFT_26656 [Periconia macrospinosa]
MAAPISKAGIGVIAIAVFFLMAGTLSVVARPVAKRRAKRRLKDDDYWMFVTLAAYYAWVGLLIYLIAGAMTSPELAQKSHHEVMWTLRVLYLFAITSVKLSILAFYRSIFDCLRWFQNSTLLMTALCILWFISGIVISAIIYFLPACKMFMWNTPGQNPTCMRSSVFLTVHRFLNPAVDVAILVLPMIVVPRLHIPLRQKLQAAGVFLMGGLIVFVSVAGIVYTESIWNPKRDFPIEYGMLWSAPELGMAIICGNLPTYRPLLPKRNSIQNIITSWRSTWSRKSTTPSNKENVTPISQVAQAESEIQLTSDRTDVHAVNNV